jgi:hypothetical protein
VGGQFPRIEGLMSLFRGSRFGPASRRVLEDAFRTRVMNELPAGDQPLFHGHFAPRAETVGEIRRARVGGGIHGPAFSMRAKNLVNRLL